MGRLGFCLDIEIQEMFTNHFLKGPNTGLEIKLPSVYFSVTICFER